MKIPRDANMLVSLINMKLRDFYSDFDELCKSECLNKDEIEKILLSADFRYDKERNQFV